MKKVCFIPKHGSRVFCLIFLIFSFLSLSQVQADEPQYGGRVTLLGEVETRGFDAIATKSLVAGGRAIACLVMEKLFKRSQTGELIPVLGLSAETSSDGTTWTIRLRRG